MLSTTSTYANRLHHNAFAFLTVAALGLSLVAGCSHAKPMVQPAPLQTKAEAETVHQAILQAMVAKKWRVEKDEPGVVGARLEARNHTLVVAIHYGNDSVSFEYVSSTNLEERKDADGTVYIHTKYRNWTENLMAEISRQLLAGPPPAPAAPPPGPAPAAP